MNMKSFVFFNYFDIYVFFIGSYWFNDNVLSKIMFWYLGLFWVLLGVIVFLDKVFYFCYVICIFFFRSKVFVLENC